MGKRYTYKCGKGHEFEVTRRMVEVSNMKCGHKGCKSKKFRRKYKAPTISFKGAGFYATDNKK